MEKQNKEGKCTKTFQDTIEAYIKSRIDVIENKHPDKSIEGCCKYILSTVKKSGCEGFTDDEIYSMAVHYYDEPNEALGKIEDLSGLNIVVNHKVELTTEEREEARKEAIERLVKEQMDSMRKKPASKPVSKPVANNTTTDKPLVEQNQLDLF